MTLQECTRILAPLAVTLRVDLDAPTFRAYFRALEDVPLLLLQAAVDRASKAAVFMPKPAELRQFADDARRAILAAHPFEPCLCCEPSPGWIEVEVQGVTRVDRCQCWQAWRASLERLGAGSRPFALPEPEHAG